MEPFRNQDAPYATENAIILNGLGRLITCVIDENSGNQVYYTVTEFDPF